MANLSPTGVAYQTGSAIVNLSSGVRTNPWTIAPTGDITVQDGEISVPISSTLTFSAPNVEVAADVNRILWRVLTSSAAYRFISLLVRAASLTVDVGPSELVSEAQPNAYGSFTLSYTRLSPAVAADLSVPDTQRLSQRLADIFKNAGISTSADAKARVDAFCAALVNTLTPEELSTSLLALRKAIIELFIASASVSEAVITVVPTEVATAAVSDSPVAIEELSGFITYMAAAHIAEMGGLLEWSEGDIQVLTRIPDEHEQFIRAPSGFTISVPVFGLTGLHVPSDALPATLPVDDDLFRPDATARNGGIDLDHSPTLIRFDECEVMEGEADLPKFMSALGILSREVSDFSERLAEYLALSPADRKRVYGSETVGPAQGPEHLVKSLRSVVASVNQGTAGRNIKLATEAAKDAIAALVPEDFLPVTFPDSNVQYAVLRSSTQFTFAPVVAGLDAGSDSDLTSYQMVAGLVRARVFNILYVPVANGQVTDPKGAYKPWSAYPFPGGYLDLSTLPEALLCEWQHMKRAYQARANELVKEPLTTDKGTSSYWWLLLLLIPVLAIVIAVMVSRRKPDIAQQVVTKSAASSNNRADSVQSLD